MIYNALNWQRAIEAVCDVSATIDRWEKEPGFTYTDEYGDKEDFCFESWDVFSQFDIACELWYAEGKELCELSPEERDELVTSLVL